MCNNLAASSKGTELGKRLLARAPHTNKQSMAAIYADDPMHSCQMFQCIIKKHKIHLGPVVVVFLKYFLWNDKRVVERKIQLQTRQKIVTLNV